MEEAQVEAVEAVRVTEVPKAPQPTEVVPTVVVPRVKVTRLDIPDPRLAQARAARAAAAAVPMTLLEQMRATQREMDEFAEKIERRPAELPVPRLMTPVGQTMLKAFGEVQRLEQSVAATAVTSPTYDQLRANLGKADRELQLAKQAFYGRIDRARAKVGVARQQVQANVAQANRLGQSTQEMLGQNDVSRIRLRTQAVADAARLGRDAAPQQQQVLQQQARVDQLRAQGAQVAQRVQQVAPRVDELQLFLDQARQQRDALNQQQLQQAAAQQQAQNRFNTSRAQLAAQSAQVASLASSVRDRDVLLAKAQSDALAQQSRIQQLEASLATAAGVDVSALQAELSAERAKQTEVNTKVEGLQADAAKAKADLEAQRKKAADLEAAQRQAASDLKAEADKRAKVEEDLKSVEDKLALQGGELAAAAAEKEQLEKQSEAFKKQAQEAEDETTKLREKLLKAAKDAQEQSAALNKAVKDVKDQDALLKAGAEEVKKLLEGQKDNETKLLVQQNKLNAQAKKIKDLEKRNKSLAEAQKDLEEAIGEQQKLEEEIDELLDGGEEDAATIQALQKKLEAARQSYIKIQGEVAALTRERDAVAAKLAAERKAHQAYVDALKPMLNEVQGDETPEQAAAFIRLGRALMEVPNVKADEDPKKMLLELSRKVMLAQGGDVSAPFQTYLRQIMKEIDDERDDADDEIAGQEKDILEVVRFANELRQQELMDAMREGKKVNAKEWLRGTQRAVNAWVRKYKEGGRNIERFRKEAEMARRRREEGLQLGRE